MVVAEKKFGKILPNMAKRAAKIVFVKNSKEDRGFVAQRKKAYKEAQKKG